MFEKTRKVVTEKDYHFNLLRKNYLQRRKYDISIFNEALDTEDFDKIANMAHQIIGNARMYNFKELEPFAAMIASSCRLKDTSSLRMDINKLALCLSKLKT